MYQTSLCGVRTMYQTSLYGVRMFCVLLGILAVITTAQSQNFTTSTIAPTLSYSTSTQPNPPGSTTRPTKAPTTIRNINNSTTSSTPTVPPASTNTSTSTTTSLSSSTTLSSTTTVTTLTPTPTPIPTPTPSPSSSPTTSTTASPITSLPASPTPTSSETSVTSDRPSRPPIRQQGGLPARELALYIGIPLAALLVIISAVGLAVCASRHQRSRRKESLPIATHGFDHVIPHGQSCDIFIDPVETSPNKNEHTLTIDPTLVNNGIDGPPHHHHSQTIDPETPSPENLRNEVRSSSSSLVSLNSQ